LGLCLTSGFLCFKYLQRYETTVAKNILLGIALLGISGIMHAFQLSLSNLFGGCGAFFIGLSLPIMTSSLSL
jgi:hypothetical protein